MLYELDYKRVELLPSSGSGRDPWVERLIAYYCTYEHMPLHYRQPCNREYNRIYAIRCYKTVAFILPLTSVIEGSQQSIAYPPQP